MNLSPVRLALLLIPLVLACFALSPQARATCQDACLSNNNTVQGDDALISTTTGTDNTAIGFNALFSTTIGSLNTGVGSLALFSNMIGIGNTALGFDALFANSTGSNNTGSGVNALLNNTTGSGNTATGVNALIGNNGSLNTASGSDALRNNTTGGGNVALGSDALFGNTTGGNNIALGSGAGSNLTTGGSNIDIGNAAVPAESRIIRIGTKQTHKNTYIAGISGVTVPTGIAVIVDTNGHLGTTTSSARYKDEIKPMDNASEAILALKPVTFHYKKDLDPDGIPQFGLVAEQVEKVNRDLVARDEQGKPYTVRYDAVNAMLLNEFLKARRQIDAQQKQIEALTAGLEKVSAQLAAASPSGGGLELSKSAPQTVLNNH